MNFVFNDKSYRHLAMLTLCVIGVLIAFTFQHYGISWDEEIQSQYGQAIVDYYSSFFVDHRFKQIFNLYLYGGMFDGLASWLDRTSPLGIYPTRHLLNAILGLIGLWGTWRLGRLQGGNKVGLIALLLLALTPMYYGHMFNNPKDIPFAAGVVWSIYYMVKCLRAPIERLSWTLVARIGIILGLTLGVRVGGVMLFGYWSTILFLQNRRQPMKAVKLIAQVGMIAYIVMLICWPWAQENPILNPLRALGEFSNFPQNVEVLLNGITYLSTQLPWFYLPVYFAVQLPLLHLTLFAAACVMMPLIWRELATMRGRQATLVLMALMMGFPVCYAMIRRPALYDAVRHFIFVLPLLSVFAALAAMQILTRLRPFPNARRLLVAIVGLIACFHIVEMVRLHPYEYIYINALEGGVEGGYGQYELDYWGSSFKEAAERLQSYVANEGGIPSGKIYKIAICGPWSAAMIYLPPDYEPVTANQQADFFLSTTRWGCQNMRTGGEIIRIERLGAPLSIIKDMRPFLKT